MPARPVLVGVTGGIGSGKSTAVERFRQRGAAVFSADEVVHGLYASPHVRDAVRARWGDRVMRTDGSVDRDAVAHIVFVDDDERRWLESLLHPLVAQAWLEFQYDQEHLNTPPPMIVAEIPLLFEAGLQDLYDVTVVVTASPEVRARRLLARGAGATVASGRIHAQMPDDEKRRLADFTCDNDGDVAALERGVDSIFDAICAPSPGSGRAGGAN